MVISEIKLYNLLKAKLGDQEAEVLLHLVEEKVDIKFEENNEKLATKSDINRIELEMSNMEARLTMRMFLFWIGQLGAFIAIVKFLL